MVDLFNIRVGRAVIGRFYFLFSFFFAGIILEFLVYKGVVVKKVWVVAGCLVSGLVEERIFL